MAAVEAAPSTPFTISSLWTDSRYRSVIVQFVTLVILFSVVGFLVSNAVENLAKQGKKVDADACPSSPVEAHYNLGSVFNISGTPTIVTDKGKIIVGYLPPQSLLVRLNEES